MKYNKKRLFEVMSKVDKSFKSKLNEGYGEILIIPEKIGGEDNPVFDGMKLANFIYLDGELESKAGYDLFSFGSEMPQAEGVYDAIVDFQTEKIPATLYMWERPELPAGSRFKFMGLVVAKDDIQAQEKAKRKFEAREDSL